MVVAQLNHLSTTSVQPRQLRGWTLFRITDSSFATPNAVAASSCAAKAQRFLQANRHLHRLRLKETHPKYAALEKDFEVSLIRLLIFRLRSKEIGLKKCAGIERLAAAGIAALSSHQNLESRSYLDYCPLAHRELLPLWAVKPVVSHIRRMILRTSTTCVLKDHHNIELPRICD
jgi:hypothetical protein